MMGVINVENLAAPVVPDIRMVRSRRPWATAAVRMAGPVFAPASSAAERFLEYK
jgi:hypothetical protein